MREDEPDSERPGLKPERKHGAGLTLYLALATGVYFSLSGLPVFHLAVPVSGLVLGLFSVEREVQRYGRIGRSRPALSDYLGAVAGSGILHALGIVLFAALTRYLDPVLR